MYSVLLTSLIGTSADSSFVESIGYPAVVLGAMGLLFGLGLAIAAKKFAVERDPRVEQINDLLPGANCGGCALPGCMAFAEAVVAGKAPANGCVAASASVNAKVAEAVGAAITDDVRKIALVHCNGGHSAQNAFQYHGPSKCASAILIMDGEKTCTYGCLGFGDCVDVCLFDAIVIGDDRIPIVDRKNCTGCGKCVDACPRNIIELWPVNREVVIACASLDKGGAARKACAVACIGCHKCAKICPVDAIEIEDFLARIDPEICTNCGLCRTECPTNAILDFAPGRPKAYIDSSCVGCTLCTKACPVEAITGELKEMHEVNNEKCVGCGLCIAKCPKDSIRMRGALSYQRGEEYKV